MLIDQSRGRVGPSTPTVPPPALQVGWAHACGRADVGVLAEHDSAEALSAPFHAEPNVTSRRRVTRSLNGPNGVRADSGAAAFSRVRRKIAEVLNPGAGHVAKSDGSAMGMTLKASAQGSMNPF